jgi:hypothetical protein
MQIKTYRFGRWVRAGAVPIRNGGVHCVRHGYVVSVAYIFVRLGYIRSRGVHAIRHG